MNQQEFLQDLRRMLARNLDSQTVEDTIRYYEEYIRQEKAGGKAEKEILEALGDPRMIARTILDVDQQKEENKNRFEEETVYTENEEGKYEKEEGPDKTITLGKKTFVIHTSSIKGWLILILVVVLLLLVLGTVFTIVWKLLPALLVFGLLVWIYRNFFEHR